MDVLCHLMRRAGEMVSREELICSIWQGREGGDESLTRAIALLRRAFAQDGRSIQYIRTGWKRGYQLVAPVRACVDSGSSLAQVPISTNLYDNSVAVLPMASAGLGPQLCDQADGVTRDLTLQLSTVPNLRVAPFSSARWIEEGALPLRAIASALGVRYVVSGSLSRCGALLEVRIGVMDGKDDAHLTGHRYAIAVDDFGLHQDALVSNLARVVLQAVEASRDAILGGRRPYQLSGREFAAVSSWRNSGFSPQSGCDRSFRQI